MLDRATTVPLYKKSSFELFTLINPKLNYGVVKNSAKSETLKEVIQDSSQANEHLAQPGSG